MLMELLHHAQALMTAINANPMLVAGLGTVGLSSILYVCRSVPATIWHWITTVTTCDFIINTRHDEFNNVLNLLYKHRIPALSRHFALPYNEQKLALGYGTCYGIYRGTFFVFYKKQLENKNEIEDQITITFLTRKLEKMQAFVDEAAYIDKERTYVEVYFSCGQHWDCPVERQKRPIESVYIEEVTKQAILERINKFYAEKDWYNRNGIPWKLCILLHGIPGTGKTSLIRALASHYNKDIRFAKDLNHIDTLCEDLNVGSFIILEDIDAMGQLEKRNDSDDNEEDDLSNRIANGRKVNTPYGKGIMMAPKQPEKRTEISLFSKLSTLLNTLDGIRTPEGPIWFMTTNHIESLDHALLRKGRVDMTIELGPLSYTVMAKMFENYYGIYALESLESWAETHTYVPKTGAELQDIFMTSDIKGALEKLSS
jgi:chaperone BCS1